MLRYLATLTLLVALTLTAPPAIAAPPASANVAYDNYVRTTETRLATQHSSAQNFLAPSNCGPASGQSSPCVERVTVTGMPGALLHHWRATEFVPGANAADFDRILQTVNAYPRVFAPQVKRASATQLSTDRIRVAMRLRQRHVLTVVLDADYDVSFAQLDPQRRYSTSRSVRISEIDSPDTSSERTLPENEERGFLWRQNTYWSCEERDGGLYIQVESLSLTRSIPTGLGWAIGPYVESIPRDSLEFTLRSVSAALPHTQTTATSQTH